MVQTQNSANCCLAKLKPEHGELTVETEAGAQRQGASHSAKTGLDPAPRRSNLTEAEDTKTALPPEI